MKIHKPLPKDLIRVSITKSGEETKYMSLEDVTQIEAIDAFKEWLKPYVYPYSDGDKKTSINIREAIGGKNGATKTFSFYGLNTEKVYTILLNNIEHQTD